MRALLLLISAATFGTAAAAEPLPPAHAAFQMSAQAKRTLAQAAAALKPGDSCQSVIRKLGKPNSDEKLVAKESSRAMGRSLRYDAVIWEAGLVNELYDEGVEVFLDEHDRVKSVSITLTLE